MYDIINRYINKMTKDDVKNFALTQNIQLNNEEASFIYTFLKKNWEELLGNPNGLIMEKYRNQFSEENYNKINNLVNYYRSTYLNNIKR